MKDYVPHSILIILLTIQEPEVVCINGYSSGRHAPGISQPAKLPYQCAHNILKSHALAYRIYEAEFKEAQGGQVGITLNTDWFEPGSENQVDIEAAERAMQFQVSLHENYCILV